MNPYPYGPPAPGYAPQPHQAPPHQAAALYRVNVFVPPHARGGDVPSPTTRKIKLACGIAQLVMLLFAVMGIAMAAILGDDDGGQAFAIMSVLAFCGWYLALIGYQISNVVWVYKFWSWIPPEQRWTNLWKKYTSPGQAAGFMFIPYFNIYWLFVVYLGICDVFERLRVAYPTDKKSPKDFAVAMLIVSFLFFPAAPFMHYVFAKKCEDLAHDIQARMGPRVA